MTSLAMERRILRVLAQYLEAIAAEAGRNFESELAAESKARQIILYAENAIEEEHDLEINPLTLLVIWARDVYPAARPFLSERIGERFDTYFKHEPQ